MHSGLDDFDASLDDRSPGLDDEVYGHPFFNPTMVSCSNSWLN